MIGCKTGKVVGYAVRSKTCAKCERGAGDHLCRKNWTGNNHLGLKSHYTIKTVILIDKEWYQLTIATKNSAAVYLVFDRCSFIDNKHRC